MRRYPWILSCSLLIAIGLAAVDAAAQTLRVTPGTRVRVSTRPLPHLVTPSRHSGTVHKVDGDRLTIVRGDRTTAEFERADIARIEESTGHDSRVGRFFLGAGVGLMVGITFGAIAGSGSEPSGFYSRNDAMAMGAVMAGTVGAVLGGLIGAATGGERWETVYHPGYGLGIAPQGDGGVTVAAVHRF